MPERDEARGIQTDHECDLFLMSSHQAYLADQSLDLFARLGRRNIHGWGIGGYADDRGIVVRSSRPAAEAGTASEEFKIGMGAMCSGVILGHLRLASAGSIRPENNHPFRLEFLGSDWLFVHNGTARNDDQLVPQRERLLVEADNDSARVFEFLRRQIIDYYCASPQRGLLEAVRTAYGKLLDEDPGGSFNIILTNGKLSFAFSHWRPFYCLRRPKDNGDAALLSTLDLGSGQGTESWTKFETQPGKQAKMLVFSGPHLVLNGDVPR